MRRTFAEPAKNNYSGRNISIGPYQPAQNGQPAQTVQANFYSAGTTAGGFFGSGPRSVPACGASNLLIADKRYTIFSGRDRLATYGAALDKKILKRSSLRFNMAIALLVWAIWLAFGGRLAIYHLFADWKVALTMVFGSLVGGGTSEGGGAIAFPIFTKLLHIAPRDARNFSLAIQSVGMGAASLSILYLRIPIERRALLLAGIPGVLGVVFGAYFVAPLVPPVFVRTSFTVLVSSMGVALLLINREKTVLRNERIPIFGVTEMSILIVAGFFGGVASALVGTGENSVVFMVMVLLFRVSEKIVTPTTVILMTMVTIPGFLFHVFVLRDFTPALMGYWLAAVPVVAVGAPAGALICSHMKRHAIVLLLLFLIALEFFSTLLLVPMSRPVLLASLATLAVCGCIDWAMSRATRYRPESLQPSSLTGEAEV